MYEIKSELVGLNYLHGILIRPNPKQRRLKGLKKMEVMNECELTEDSISEFLHVSKQLDDLLLNQEIFWCQRS